MDAPEVRSIVLALVDPKANNGADVAPAVVTRVWCESTVDGADRWTVNYRVLLDGPDVPWKTSAFLYADEATARGRHPDGADGAVAFCPPRV